MIAQEPQGAEERAVLSPRLATPESRMPWLPALHHNPFADLILAQFDWRAYLRANPDVAANSEDEQAALHHFFYQGYRERRIFDPDRLRLFDPGYYRERYPELGLASDEEAQVHYCYLGHYEGRSPSLDMAYYIDADLHVFQMGKVGSNSIERAMATAGVARKAFHLHWVADFHFATRGIRAPYRDLLLRPRSKPMQVVSGTREIVSWALAWILHHEGPGLGSVQAAHALLEERFVPTCEAGLAWFDHQYFCGLDVYSYPFDPKAGAIRIHHAPLDLVIYRQEDLPRLSGFFADFLMIPGLQIGQANVAKAKSYSHIYREVMRNIAFPGNLLARLYDRPFMRHFYSDEEREKAYAKWVA